MTDSNDASTRRKGRAVETRHGTGIRSDFSLGCTAEHANRRHLVTGKESLRARSDGALRNPSLPLRATFRKLCEKAKRFYHPATHQRDSPAAFHVADRADDPSADPAEQRPLEFPSALRWVAKATPRPAEA